MMNNSGNFQPLFNRCCPIGRNWTAHVELENHFTDNLSIVMQILWDFVLFLSKFKFKWIDHSKIYTHHKKNGEKTPKKPGGGGGGGIQMRMGGGGGGGGGFRWGHGMWDGITYRKKRIIHRKSFVKTGPVQRWWHSYSTLWYAHDDVIKQERHWRQKYPRLPWSVYVERIETETVGTVERSRCKYVQRMETMKQSEPWSSLCSQSCHIATKFFPNTIFLLWYCIS